VKPHRVKRVDPQSRPGEFSQAACGPSRAGDPLTGPRLGGASWLARCTFSAVECHDRFCGGDKPGGKVARSFGGECLQATVVRTSRDRGRLPRQPASGRSGVLELGRTASQGAVTALRTRVRTPSTPRVSGESVGPPPDPS
jgi:hypothetical protein